jgi:hypothetical protein
MKLAFDRARWTGKGREADIFRQWLMARLQEADLNPESAADREPEPAETPVSR